MENLAKETRNDKLSTELVEMSISDLTYNQKQKYAVLRRLYPDDETTLALVHLIEGKGENSYKNVINKITAIDQADRMTALYHDNLYDNFELNKFYNYDDIIGDVSSIRMDHGFKPYTSRFKKNCEFDFVSIFIVRPEYEVTSTTDELTGEVKTKKTHIGYTPLFKLKPED